MHRSIPLAGLLTLAAPWFAFAQEPPAPSRDSPAATAPSNLTNRYTGTTRPAIPIPVRPM